MLLNLNFSSTKLKLEYVSSPMSMSLCLGLGEWVWAWVSQYSTEILELKLSPTSSDVKNYRILYEVTITTFSYLLSMFQQMHKTLEEMLAAAQNAINLAEQGKLEKEEAAQKSFADLELVMEKVVQELKVLKQQAEENSKVVPPFSVVSDSFCALS